MGQAIAASPRARDWARSRSRARLWARATAERTGRDPFLRLPPCAVVPDCSLYTVRPGDRLSTIAGRFGITVEAILAANPQIGDANAIFSGQVVRLPHPGA